ncbi:SAM-dependent methyltransferase [Streptomyces sp. SudanB52_2052]|uniref:SAM-dependent methyltransferase n=1 Tax=Streptomyces sp. SudanB52_2052 TaxID=3035276 RepID=UPI003F566D54
MTPPHHTRLTFHGPLSEARANRLVRRLAGNAPATVLDIGCGWGELMLRVLAATPGATGTGIDLDAEDLARGRQAAQARGLTDRVRFLEESATGTTRGPADLVLCVGASQALGDLSQALAELRRLVRDDGRVLLGEGFWQRTPTPAELSRMWPDAAATDHPDLATLVGLAVDAGFRPEWTETASLEEWEEFESAYLADTEVWLAGNPGHPLAEETRQRADRHRAAWLTYRGVLGLAYLTLVPVAR